MNEQDPTRIAVEKMKLAALQGIPGEPIGEDLPAQDEDAQITLPPHRRILKVEDVNEALPTREKIPAAQLARVVFKLSTGEAEEQSTLTVGEGRVLTMQLTHLNQALEGFQKATLLAETVLKEVVGGGAAQHRVVDAIAALKKARQ